MLLSHSEIRDAIEQGRIDILPPFDKRQLRGVGIRTHLADDILVPLGGQQVQLDGSSETSLEFRSRKLSHSGYLLRPGGFILGATLEKFRIDRTLCCRLDGRSTTARLGLMVHCTSTTIDGLYADNSAIVLEICNVGPFDIMLTEGSPVAMVLFETLSSRTDSSFDQSQYSRQSSVLPPNTSYETPSLELK